MPPFYIFGAQSDAAALAANVDGQLGYPRAGVDIGAGMHAPAAESVTTTYAGIAAHPSGTQWAYPIDATNQPAVSASPTQTSKGTQTATLDATWTAPDPKVQAQPATTAGT